MLNRIGVRERLWGVAPTKAQSGLSVAVSKAPMKHVSRIKTVLSRALFGSLASVLAGLPLAAGVIVVDVNSGPGSDYTLPSSAVLAAAEGDTILIRDGFYPSFTITGKSLTVIADGANVQISSSITVEDLAAGQQVLVRGVQVDFGVKVYDCVGAVWFDQVDCVGIPIVVSQAVCAAYGQSGAFIQNSDQVTLTCCSLKGQMVSGASGWLPATPGSGVNAIESTVQIFDSTLTGGRGETVGATNSWGPSPGGAGLTVASGADVTVIGCTIEGGGGGVWPTSMCTSYKAPGGPGVNLSGGNGILRSAESTAVGGATDLQLFCGTGVFGPAGQPFTGPGTILPLPGFARHLSVNSPVRGGETLTFDLEGQPGELPIIITSPVHQPIPFGSGSLLLQLPPTDIFVLPLLPSNGKASLTFPVQNVGLGVGAVTLYAQAAFIDTTPTVWIGAGSSTVLLDASF